jgi:hypothetical protein
MNNYLYGRHLLSNRWFPAAIIMLMVLAAGTAIASHVECPKHNFTQQKYSIARKSLLNRGWHVEKPQFTFDEHGEIVCGSVGTCWASFWKDVDGDRCLIDLELDKIEDDWSVISQE